MLEKTLESSLDNKEIKTVNPKGYEYSLEGLLPMQRADSLEKILFMGKIEGRRRKRVTEKEMVRCHH